jgi:hypothetical protein
MYGIPEWAAPRKQHLRRDYVGIRWHLVIAIVIFINDVDISSWFAEDTLW